MIYIMKGQDDYSISRTLDEKKKSIGDESMLAMSVITLEGAQLSLEELKTVCETLPFMTGKRLVIVNGLIGRFEKKEGSRRQQSKSARNNRKQEEAGVFISYLAAGIPDSTVLVLVEGDIKNDNPVYKEISKKARVESFPLPKDDRLREWVERLVREEGGTISTKAVHLLARLVEGNLWIMAGEVNKLVSYTAGRRIEEEDIKALVGYNQQATVFKMVDAILEFKLQQAEQTLEQLFQEGAAPVYLLSMIARQVQLIVRSRELVSQRRNNQEIQAQLGIKNEWVMKKTIEQASRYSVLRLREVYRSLLDTDISIKTGKTEPELALNMLVAELCRRGGGKPARAGAGAGR